MSRAIPSLCAVAVAIFLLHLPGTPEVAAWLPDFPLAHGALIAVLMVFFGVWGMLSPKESAPAIAKPAAADNV